jgi:protein-tyrosine phosphatase
VIDLHCHVLAGIDDGPETIEGSVSLATAAAAAGTRILVATPHVSQRYRNDPDTISRSVAELNDRLADEDIPVEVRIGAEIALTRVADIESGQLARLGLGGGPWLLVEPPFSPGAENVDSILLALQRRGAQIVLAHPERCPAFQRQPQMLASLVEAGMLTSITAGSLVGRFGRDVQRFALELSRLGFVHNVASDAHALTGRPPGVQAELAQAGLSPLAEWLTEAVPAAVLAGTEIPPRPHVPPQLPPSNPASWWRRHSPKRAWR